MTSTDRDQEPTIFTMSVGVPIRPEDDRRTARVWRFESPETNVTILAIPPDEIWYFVEPVRLLMFETGPITNDSRPIINISSGSASPERPLVISGIPNTVTVVCRPDRRSGAIPPNAPERHPSLKQKGKK